MAVEAALSQLSASAGADSKEALDLLSKLLTNIAEHPAEGKFRKLKPDNPKLKQGLFRHAGAGEFLLAAGFARTPDGCYEFSDAAVAPVRDACALVDARRHGGSLPAASGYRAVVEGGACGAGLAELEAIVQQPGGVEGLEILKTILENLRRYPDSDRYRCVNLSKPAARKVLPAAPLLRIAGFEEAQLPTGEHCMKLARRDPDVLERVWAMALWATLPSPPPAPQPPTGGLLDRALGAAIGAAVGDALGAPLGRRGPGEVTAAEVDKAMEMCGGGFWGVAPGQVTGNFELAVCLASCLAEASDAARSFDLEALAAGYGKWGSSKPFHAERACIKAFERPLPAEIMRERAKDLNQKSTGSGALIRCTPIAVLAAAAGNPAAAASLARQDAQMSHPSTTVGNASAAYAVAVASLILGDGDRRAAMDKLQAWLRQEMAGVQTGASQLALGDGGPSGWAHLSRGSQPQAEQRPASAADEKAWEAPGERLVALEVVTDWLKKAFADAELAFSDFSAEALLLGEVGTVEIPFTHAFRHLHRGSTFEVAMRAVLAGGGDSCTTAAAVGGLLGAALGVRGLPPRWVRAVLASDAGLGQNRPPDYQPGCLPGLVERICARR